VRQFRLASKSAPTRALAATPTRFHVENIPHAPYLVIPEVSSSRRYYIPIGFLMPETLASNKLRIMQNADLFSFGIIQSKFHMAWMAYTTGRLKSDYQYSVSIVYNNYPWPDPLDDKARAAIEAAAQGVLDARAEFPDSTLADLYDPLTMPPALVKAHQKLDHAVDAAYLAAEKAAGRKPPRLNTDAERVAFLFERYQALVSLLPTAKPAKSRRRKAGADASDLDR
jgi:hypothetical protein